jgi:hypothetical protein
VSASVRLPKMQNGKRIKNAIAMLLIAQTCLGQQQQPIQDLSALVGKQVIAQRMPLCQPGTYTTVLAYAGKPAKVISLKPLNVSHLSQANMSRLTPEARAMLEDTYKSATILVQFEDGTRLDSCGPVRPSSLSDYFELVPGQTLPPVSQGATSSTPTPLTQLPDALSDDELKMALAGRGRDHWVSIEDMGFSAAQGSQAPSITLYMPEAVLAMKADLARKQFTQYEPSDEDKRRSLMIIAQGYVGGTIAEGCTSITRVVLLSDPSGAIVKEAYLSEPSEDTWRNGFGATNSCQALRSKFSLADVQKVRAAAPDGEFFVAVFSGSVNTKMYKIKKKFQSKLGLD